MKQLMKGMAAAILMLAAIACEDKLVPEEVIPGSGNKTFTATTESQATKTALSQNGTAYDVVWQSGDQITVVDGSATPKEGIYTTTDEGTKAVFTLTAGREAIYPNFKAYYPATLYDMYDNGAMALPATQTYVAGNITGAPMYAESATQSLSFKNLCGIVRLNLTTTQSNVVVKSISLSADQGMSGVFTVSGNAAVIGSSTAGVTLDCGEGVALGSTAVPFYLAVPQNTSGYTNLRITVTTATGATQTRTATKPIKVERSSITGITLSFNNLKLEATDLSATETANTYIVSSAGTYKFNAMVKGNGSSETISLSDIDGVTVLWELNSYGKAIKYQNSAYDIFVQDGYVYFRTPDTFTTGDAYVAVFKDGAGGMAGVYDKDTDEILWSWLIWATDAPATTTVNGIQYLDRNLGSLSTGHRGFCYQWGRKDPFSGCDRHNGNNVSYSFAPARTEAFQFSTDLASVAYTVAHPTTYIMTSTDAHWVTEADYSHLWWDYEKTMYDPCPAGWKVPSKDDIATGFPSVGATGFIGSGSTTDFPYGNTDIGYYWTSTSENWNQVWGFYNDGRALQQDNHQRNGFAVRCVKDEVTNIVYTDLSATATANSYIVPAAGNYKFKATVKGNGAANLAGINKNTDAADIVSAGLVWATFGTATAPTDRQLIRGIHYKDGYVFFSTGNPYVEGNALVSINDASGNILWSWHLWFESDNLESLKQTYPGGAVFMDRNLGAISAAYSSENTFDFGLLYQWGRKDPFTTACNRTKPDNTVQAVLANATNTSLSRVPVATTVLNPFTLYCTTMSEISPWYPDTQEDKDVLWAGSKTIFDPCPPGWKVPSKNAWNNEFLTAFQTAAISSGQGMTLNFSSQAVWYPDAAMRLGTPAVYITTAGKSTEMIGGKGEVKNLPKYFIHNWAVDGVLKRASYTINQVAESCGVFELDADLNHQFTSPSQTFGLTIDRDNAWSVRCVKE